MGSICSFKSGAESPFELKVGLGAWPTNNIFGWIFFFHIYIYIFEIESPKFELVQKINVHPSDGNEQDRVRLGASFSSCLIFG